MIDSHVGLDPRLPRYSPRPSLHLAASAGGTGADQEIAKLSPQQFAHGRPLGALAGEDADARGNEKKTKG